jgi:DoxX-like family
VGETSLFLIFSGASTLLASRFIVQNRDESASEVAARVFYWICFALSVAALLWITFGALGWFPVSATSAWWFRILIYRAWLVVGTAVSCAVLLVLSGSLRVIAPSHATRAFLTSSCVLQGISLSVSISFFCIEIGKLTHDADMRQFFLQSGFSPWFLYFIITLETLGAIGLFFPRTAGGAALGLAGIMVGAIGTHVHNRDPFSDSLEALHLLLLLASILVIRRLQGNRREQTSLTPEQQRPSAIPR